MVNDASETVHAPRLDRAQAERPPLAVAALVADALQPRHPAPPHAPPAAAPGMPPGTLVSGNPSDEYKSVCELMRLYATLRFYQLALLLGTTGSIVTALSSAAVRASFARVEFLRAGGFIVCAALLVMEFRATSYWHALRRRANELAQALSFQPFPSASRWNPLTTSGAGFYLHALIASLWFVSLVLNLPPVS